MDTEILLMFACIFQRLLISTTCCCSECCNYRPMDCLDYKDLGYKESGVYRIYPPDMNKGYEVFCDMTTDDGGWTIFQRREDGSEEFNRNWKDYKIGFGNVSHEHWLGFIPLMRITSKGFYELRIDLTNWQNETRYAVYKIFSIDHEDSYRLNILHYTGNAGDAMEYHDGMKFTTIDQDNDELRDANCVEGNKGPWWFNSCHNANLNGIYYKDGADHIDGVIWGTWYGDHQIKYTTMKTAEMKIRRT